MIADGGPTGNARLFGRLLAGATACALLASPVLAQPASPATGAPSAQPSAEDTDGLAPKSFYLEADTVAQDESNKTITAEGHVELRYRGRTLRAQTLVYDTDSGVVTAKGDVAIVNPDGTAEFAREIVLDDDMSAGVALGFSARLKGNVKIAADSVIRRSADVSELNRAIYTPCSICAEDGKSKQPTWSIQASKVVQDKAHHVIYYHNAVIRVLGAPVLLTPVFWTPDADAKAQSGFLSPKVQLSRRRGFYYEQPYLFVIDKSQDLTVSPILSSKVNPFLNLEWRKKLAEGLIDARVGYTYEREFDNSGNPIPGTALTSRSYVLASGDFRINSHWSAGFGAERVTDDLLFDRYDIPGVYDRRGLFDTDSRRLLSQAFVIRQDQQSYLSVSALNFQGLRIGDLNAAMPVVAPLVEARWEPDASILGGRLLLVGSGVVLERKRDPINPAIAGLDSRRATVQGDWRGAYTLSNGVRIEPFGSGRFDIYSVSDFGPALSSSTSSRGIASAGVDLSYPLIRRAGDATIVLEPLAEGVISQEATPDPAIPNQDSVDFVFDETNLFDPNRAPGFDVYDSGARLNLGGRATIDWGDGRQLRAFVGRSFRNRPDSTLPSASGYSDRSSDWILAASATPIRGLTVYSRTLFDGNQGTLRRQEAGVDVIVGAVQGYARYLHDYTDPNGEREVAEAAGDVFVTKHWGIVVYGMRDLQKSIWARRDVGVVYQDDCTRVELVYHHEAAFLRLGGPSDSVQLRLTLATLGEQRYRDQNRR